MNYIVYINNRDRLTTTRELAGQCTQLEHVGEVVIIDNDSSYPPLLDWYETCPYRIVQLGFNGGPRGLWTSKEPLDNYFVNTDSDLDLGKCPKGVLSLLRYGLDQFPEIVKVGVSIESNDIPDEYPFKSHVLLTEQDKWQPFPRHANYCLAGIDTTFAMYRPKRAWVGYGPALRTIRPYTARHVPWYTVTPTEEDRYYIDHLEHRSGVYFSTLEYDHRRP